MEWSLDVEENKGDWHHAVVRIGAHGERNTANETSGEGEEERQELLTQASYRI